VDVLPVPLASQPSPLALNEDDADKDDDDEALHQAITLRAGRVRVNGRAKVGARCTVL